MKTKNQKKKERRLFAAWMPVLIASSLVVIFSSILTLCCVVSLFTVSKYMTAVDNYSSELLKVMGIIGATAWLVGAMGTSIVGRCMRPKKAEKLRYIIRGYMGWGVGLVVLLFTSALFIFLRQDYIKDDLDPGFNVSNYSTNPEVRDAIDAIQVDFKCCGNENYTEWFTVKYSETSVSDEVTIPTSCCSKVACTTLASIETQNSLTPYGRGCLVPLSEYYTSIIVTRAVLMDLAAAAELAVVALFCYQSRKLFKRKLYLKEKEDLMDDNTTPLISK